MVSIAPTQTPIPPIHVRRTQKVRHAFATFATFAAVADLSLGEFYAVVGGSLVPMDGEIELFVSRLKMAGILDTTTARKLRRIAGPEADVVVYGEKVIQHVCNDFELVQKLLDESSQAYDNGTRITHDPFVDDEEGQPARRQDMSGGAGDDRHLSRSHGADGTDHPEEENRETEETDEALSPEAQALADEEAERTVRRSKLTLRNRVPENGKPEPSTDQETKANSLSDDAAGANQPHELAIQGDYADLSLDQIAQLAVQSISTRPPPVPGRSRPEAAEIPAMTKGPISISVKIDAPDEEIDKNKLNREHRPAEAVIEAPGIQPIAPNFDAIGPSTAESLLQSFMLTTMAYCQHQGFSDLHLCAGARPYVRKFGEIRFLSESPLPEDLSKKLNLCLLSAQQRAYFEAFQDYDFCLALGNGQRFRSNLLVHRDGIKGTYRMVPEKVRSIADLGFGEHRTVIEKLLSYHNGLVLVGGPVGSGKTTTLAALVDHLNRTREDHIITVEEPIEIVHNSQSCVVTQRGVGAHTSSFRRALKGALRQDPDIIVIGEMRNLETIEMAVSASETGHLVLATLHTNDASNTLNRVLDVFPPSQQSQIRAMVSESLRGIICQKLLPDIDGGVALACEILVNNRAVAAMIRDSKQQGLANTMETGKREGMVSMDASILDLWRKGRISNETAAFFLKNEVLRRQVLTAK